MRVAYLSGALRVSTDEGAEEGGPRSHVLGMVGAFERAGWTVDRHIAGDEPWARRLAPSGRQTTVRGSRWRALGADAVRAGAAAWNDRSATARLPGRHDLAYERFASFQAIGRRFARRGTPWVLETSGPFFHEAKQERGTLGAAGLAKRRELGAYRACDLLVCVSQPLAEFLAGEGIPDDHMFVLPNGVDTVRFDPAATEAQPTFPAGPLVVGFVGTVLAWQGLDTLIEAIADARHGGTEVEAVVVGDGPALPDLRRQAEALSVDGAVRFLGRVAGSAVPRSIAGFDLGFAGHVPLLHGAMYHSPLKLYEYMAMGRPVLAAAYPEAEHLVNEVGCGFTFGSREDLVAVLEKAAGEIDHLRAARSRVREYTVARHSWDSRLHDLLGELQVRGFL